MKAFLHGRTEAIRTVQPESVKFVKVLDPSFPSVECGLIVDQTFCSETASPQDKVAALRAACKYHTQLTKECSQGFGQDRSVSRYHPILKFTDSHLGTFTPCTRLSNETYMLPSLNRSAMNLRLFGFGPVTPEGYGIGSSLLYHNELFMTCPQDTSSKKRVFLSVCHRNISKPGGFSRLSRPIFSRSEQCSSNYGVKPMRDLKHSWIIMGY